MAIALVALSSLFNAWTRTPPTAASARASSASCATTAAVLSRPAARQTTRITPLRVVRLAEDGVRNDCAGRMVMSGRMADICAELDRLAEREARQALH
jgi:hypothetical protein